MRVRTRNYIEVIMQAVISVLYFVPGAVAARFWIIERYGCWTPGWQENISISKCTNWSLNYFDYNFLGTIAIYLGFAAVIVCVIQIFAKGKWRNSILVPIVVTVETLSCALYAVLGFYFFNCPLDDSYIGRDCGPVYYVQLALLLALSVISVGGYLKARKYGILEEKKNADPSADELKKYKELLDSGVITQEEFDAKKKQLLDL